MADSDLLKKLDEITTQAAVDLKTAVEIEGADAIPEISTLPLEKTKDGKHKWRKLDDVSVVATDLKASTSVSYSKQDQVGARLYQASTGGCSSIFQRFEPGFVDIQGDGLFAIFSGERHAERAMAAAISLNSFGQLLAALLATEFGETVEEMKESGLKIGADRGTLLVKRIGVRGEHNEPVWAGKPVNYATKCAQAAGAGEVVVTSRFFKDFRDNEYVRYSCGCVGGEHTGEVRPLWAKGTVDELGKDSESRSLVSRWCDNHGDEYSAAILAGKKEREGLNTGDIPKWREPKPDADSGSESESEPQAA